MNFTTVLTFAAIFVSASCAYVPSYNEFDDFLAAWNYKVKLDIDREQHESKKRLRGNGNPDGADAKYEKTAYVPPKEERLIGESLKLFRQNARNVRIPD